MIYDIRHVTSYSYESHVSFARCSLRLEPKSGDGQELISHSVDIRPRPVERTARRAQVAAYNAFVEERERGVR